jgi:hypothetical protein
MGSANFTLPRPVQEHLGRQLRATYLETQDMPAYVGDPALPLHFDAYLHRLASLDIRRAERCGLAAVSAALSFGSGPSAP